MAFNITNVVTNFNALMTAVDAKITPEYDSQRLVGSDYASVYLGSMQAAMQTALGYETQGQIAEGEVALLGQKLLTEEAQTKNVLSDGTVVYDTVDAQHTPGDAAVTAPVGAGVLGKQQVLYNKQTDGFDRDAEQKLIKVMSDLYAIQMSTAIVPLDLPLENRELGLNGLIKLAKDNVGVTPLAPTPEI